MKKKYSLLLVSLTFLFSCSYSSSDYTNDLGGGYTFVSESNANQLISGPGDTTWKGVIPCTVEAYAYDDLHVIVRQRDNPRCLEAGTDRLPVVYWIIDKKKKMIYGPLDSLSFKSKRHELGVSVSLNLEK